LAEQLETSTVIISRRILAGLALASVFVTTAHAQAWPNKPVRLVVPFPAGGGTDLIGREVTQKISETTKWSFIIDNKPGSGGNIGIDNVAKSPADGYSLVLGQTSNLAINPSLYSKLPYDPVKDLTPISMVASAPLALVVSATSPTAASTTSSRRPRPSPARSTSPPRATAPWPTWPWRCSRRKPASSSCMCPTRARHRASTT
jgi:hypothetical protein